MLYRHYPFQYISVSAAMRFYASLFCLLLLAGCANNVKRLNDINPPADDFPSALASEYQAYADSESEQGRLFSAEHFAGKGLKAYHGEQVDPDASDMSLTMEQQQQLSDARMQLTKLMTDDMKHVVPQKLARAQLLFDCWQHELSKGINQEQAPCEAEYHSTATELQETMDTLVFKRESRHVISFAPHSVQLNDEGREVVKGIAAQVATLPHYRVQLLVYSGIKASQRKLTDERLAAVRHALVKAGVSERHIRTKKEGGAKAVMLSRDKVERNTKQVIITVKTNTDSGEH